MSLEDASSDEFNPESLRVLVVDSNVQCLNSLMQLLQECKFRATACINASEALSKLREDPSKFDLVITEILGQEIDMFKFLEIIGLQMDIPVIDERTSSVSKGVLHGARDYLLKPLRINEIRNIWQHPVREKMQTSNEKLDGSRESSAQDQPSTSNENPEPKDHQSGGKNNKPGCSSSPHQKKPRVTWTPELHHKFVTAVNRLGEHSVPKKILEIMNEPGITRDNVASHLQKYRNMLKKQREAQQMNHPTLSPGNYQSIQSQSVVMPNFQTPSIGVTTLPVPKFRDLDLPTYAKKIKLPEECMGSPPPQMHHGYDEAHFRQITIFPGPWVSCQNPSSSQVQFAGHNLAGTSLIPNATPWVSCQDSYQIQTPAGHHSAGTSLIPHACLLSGQQANMQIPNSRCLENDYPNKIENIGVPMSEANEVVINDDDFSAMINAFTSDEPPRCDLQE